jgi:outer membrane protein assembly factor BamE (lipoprotein component of BamABCDE complex)
MTRLASILLVISALALAGCAAGSGGGSTTAQAPAAQPAPAKPVKGAPAPAGTKLSKVQMDMSPEQVRQIMGAPTAEKSYVTAKRFIPYYYGADAGTNTEWAYKSVGRVVFGVNKYTGKTRVIRIDYDPAEDGQ